MALEVAAVPPPPPRHTGRDREDIVASFNWSHDFYEAAVVNGYFLDVVNSFATVTFDPASLIDPASATVATAQETANTAYLLADQAYAEALDARPLAGSASIADPATSFVHTFAEVEPDADYYVAVSPSGFTGAPAAGSRTVVSVVKTTADFTVTIQAAPGVGASVTFDWILGRN